MKGTLAPVEHVSTRGKMPRNFAIDPTGNYLIVANQESDKLVVFHIDPETGHLTPGQVVTQRIPVCGAVCRRRLIVPSPKLIILTGHAI